MRPAANKTNFKLGYYPSVNTRMLQNAKHESNRLPFTEQDQR
jgi:hypothetical protein